MDFIASVKTNRGEAGAFVPPGVVCSLHNGSAQECLRFDDTNHNVATGCCVLPYSHVQGVKTGSRGGERACMLVVAISCVCGDVVESNWTVLADVERRCVFREGYAESHCERNKT